MSQEINDSKNPNPQPENNRNEDLNSSNGQENAFGEKIGQFAQKSAQVVKTGFNIAAEFTGSATNLAKLKVQIHNLQSARDKEYQVLGEKLYSYRDADKIDNVKSFFSEQFNSISALIEEIDRKQEETEKIELIKGSDTVEKRNEYIDKLSAQLKEWNEDIATLQQTAGQVKDDAKERYQEEINALKKHSEDAQNKLRELRDASSGAWKDVKRGAEASWNEMRNAILEAKKKF
ncbi:MAG: hypothetical protein DWQ10_00875 [Calditrichaeota bacterium]|nr:MAG: hypothetical protein DWQ10_00875 [Calditrichota bacterium]